MYKNRMPIIAFLAIIGPVAAPAVRAEGNEPGKTLGPRTTDAELFAALNLEDAALAGVKTAVERGDLPAAGRAFVRHLKERKAPMWFFDWRDKPAPDRRPAKPDLASADRYARNELVSVGVWHDFGQDVDWSINPMPSGYREWTWQLSRHPFWVVLGRAWWDTGDEKYAKAFVSQMTDWVEDNPVPLEHAANSTGSRWRTIEAGIRTGGPWFNAFYYFLSAESFTDNDIILMVKSFAEHARYLMKFPTSGNWLTMESNGLYHVGAMFPEFKEAATWRETAITRLYKELDIQVYPDGAQIELSSGYHQVSLRNFVGAMLIARLNRYPVPDDYLAKLERMYNYNLYAAMPDARLPGLNDGGYTDVRHYLTEGFEFFPQRKDFRWLATDRKKGSPPAQTSYAFPYAGQFVMRSGWDVNARYLLMDAGPFGYGHQHEDKLSFVIQAYGTNLVVDAGNYAYDSSQWRRYVVGSYAHNVIHVDGMAQNRRGFPRDQYVVKKPLPHVWRTTNEFDYASAAFGDLPQEGFGKDRQKPATHTRHILFVKDVAAKADVPTAVKDYWLVVDVLRPGDDKPHTYEAMFHLDVKDVSVDPKTKRVLSSNEKAADIAVIPVADDALEINIVKGQEKPFVQGWMPAGGYDVRPIPTAVYRRNASGVTYFVYVFYPLPAGATLPVSGVEAMGLSPEDVRVKVEFSGGRHHELQVGANPSVRRG